MLGWTCAVRPSDHVTGAVKQRAIGRITRLAAGPVCVCWAVKDRGAIVPPADPHGVSVKDPFKARVHLSNAWVGRPAGDDLLRVTLAPPLPSVAS